MTLHTKFVQRYPHSIAMIGDNGCQVMKISLPEEPWASQPIPDLPKFAPVRERFAPVTKIPDVAKPRQPNPCRFSEWDQGLLAEEWKQLCREEGHMRGLPPTTDESRNLSLARTKAAAEQYKLLRTDILEHLMQGDDTREGVRLAVRAKKSGHWDQLIIEMQSLGLIKKYMSQANWRYTITEIGRDVYGVVGDDAR